MIFTFRALLLNHPHIIINCRMILSSSLLTIYSDLYVINLMNLFMHVDPASFIIYIHILSVDGKKCFQHFKKLTVAYAKDTHSTKKSLLIHKNCSCKYLPFPLIKLEKYHTMSVVRQKRRRMKKKNFQVIIDSCVYLNDFLFISVLVLLSLPYRAILLTLW